MFIRYIQPQQTLPPRLLKFSELSETTRALLITQRPPGVRGFPAAIYLTEELCP
jgi:hypothetical protein